MAQSREDLRMHMADVSAHSAARHQQTNDWIERFQKPVTEDIMDLQRRMNDQEKWQQRLLGGFIMLSVLIGGGALDLAYHFLGGR